MNILYDGLSWSSLGKLWVLLLAATTGTYLVERLYRLLKDWVQGPRRGRGQSGGPSRSVSPAP